jgi:hypothetical protein
MRTYSFYHMVSGAVHRQRFSTDDDRASALAANTPADHVSMERVLDPFSQRVDVLTGAVVDYRPPAPSPDHECVVEPNNITAITRLRAIYDRIRALRRDP